MKILVTGATGFLGRAIVDELLQNDGYEIFTTGRSSAAGERLPNYHRADLSDVVDLKQLEKIGEVDAVIHVAGLAHQFKKTDSEKFFRINAYGTENIINLAKRLEVKKFVLISSVSVYGKASRQQNETIFEEEAVCQPEGLYAESKLESEKIAQRICQTDSIELIILRPATIIGEGDNGNVARLIRLIDSRKFVWLGSGSNLKSLIYKLDVAKACVAVIENKFSEPGKTKIYNVTAEPVSMRAIVDTVAQHLKKNVLPVHISPGIVRKSLKMCEKITRWKKFQALQETIDKWLSDEVFSGEKIKREVGFKAETSAFEGLRREVLNYQRRK